MSLKSSMVDVDVLGRSQVEGWSICSLAGRLRTTPRAAAYSIEGGGGGAEREVVDVSVENRGSCGA